MKTKIAFLTVLMTLWAGAGFASDSEPVDPMKLGRGLLARIDAIQSQCDAIEGMIGEGGAYPRYASKSVQEVIDKLTGETDEVEVGFLAALNNCVSDVHSRIDPNTMTLAALLEAKRKNLEALGRHLESMGVDIVALREEAELAKVTAAAAVLETMPSKEEVFRGDFNLRPDLGRYLHYYLTTDTFDELLGHQNVLQIQYGVDFVCADQRLPAIMQAFGREYKQDAAYLWRNLIEIISNQFCGGGKDDRIDGYLHKLKYNDTWAINNAITRSNHHKRTPQAYEWLTQQHGTKMIERGLRGLRLK